jgi:hypothetical protein
LWWRRLLTTTAWQLGAETDGEKKKQGKDIPFEGTPPGTSSNNPFICELVNALIY